MITYKLVEGASHTVVPAVNKLISEGWAIVGPAAITRYGVCQTMILDDKNQAKRATKMLEAIPDVAAGPLCGTGHMFNDNIPLDINNN